MFERTSKYVPLNPLKFRASFTAKGLQLRDAWKPPLQAAGKQNSEVSYGVHFAYTSESTAGNDDEIQEENWQFL